MNFQLCVDKKKGGKNSKGLKEASFYLELGNKKFAFANLKLNQKKGSLNFEFDEDKSGGRKKRFPYFPRLGVVAEVGGKTYSFKQGSILETLYKTHQKGWSTKNLTEAALEELNGIVIPGQSRPEAKSTKRKSKKDNPLFEAKTTKVKA